MTRSNVIASLLYQSAVSLKTVNFKRLKRKKERKSALAALSMMQFLNQCVAMKQISDGQAETILSILSNTYAYDPSEFSALLRKSHRDNNHSVKDGDLLFRMNGILSSCIQELIDNRPEHAYRYMVAFHNLPRAFLSLSDSKKLSPEQAWEYAEPHLKE